MPRFVETILKLFAHWATVALGIAILAIALFIYNKPPVGVGRASSQTYSTPGLQPSQDAGILGGIAAQRQATAALQNQVKTLESKLARLEQKPQVPSTDPKVTAALRQQLLALQQQVASSKRQSGANGAAAGADPGPPAVSLRVIRPPQVSQSGGVSNRNGGSRIQIARAVDGADNVTPAPYLPPQSFAMGRVYDGYTGLASLETFPVTIEATSAFSAANGHTVPLTGCRFGATATPEELTARGRLHLTKVTCITDTGRTIEQPVSGYVTASDNVNGQIAQIFWHEREVVAAFGKGAIPVALVSIFRETRNVVDVSSFTGVVTQSGNQVAQDVAGRIADIYLDKAEKLASPIIWVGPDTPVHIYITDGARLEGFNHNKTVAADAEPLARRMLR